MSSKLFTKAIVPPLSSHAHKGQAGKIAVIGGCREYTGAPYYSAITALKVGCDLSHIFCTEGAGTAIKAYSPEIIVHPVLKETADKEPTAEEKSNMVKSVTSWFQALHAIVVGPGLGRDKLLWETTTAILTEAKQKELPLIIDGDGLNLVCSNPGIIRGYKYAVLTPNVVEFKRLCEAVFPNSTKDKIEVKELAKELGNVTIVQKGESDVITDGISGPFECSETGSPRRCGGQGDMLTGCLAAFVTWAVEWLKNGEGKGKEHDISPILTACHAACTLSRSAAELAFQKYRRSTTTPDMIQEIGNAFEKLFPSE